MLRFARLYDAIDRTTSTNAKVDAMASYFASAPAADAAWAVFFLTGRRLKRLLSYSSIHGWALNATGLPSWILEECYAIVGDGAETAALVLDQLPTAPTDDLPLSQWLEERILPLKGLDPAEQQDRVTRWWRTLDRLQRFILLKLLSGEFRVGVSQTLVVRALAQSAQLPTATVAARMMGDWSPTAEWYARTSVRRAHRRRPLAAVSVFPGVTPRRSHRYARGSSRLADRVEVGWHPRATGQARRRPAPVVARRRAHHAPLSRRSSPPPANCRTARYSTARSSPFVTNARCRSRRCNSGSAARNRSENCRARCPSSS